MHKPHIKYFSITRLEEEKELNVPTLENVDNVYSNLAWVNQILRWFTLTNNHTSLPLHVQRWLDDVNANLDIQNVSSLRGRFYQSCFFFFYF